MSSSEKRFFHNTILEINDESKEFIPYWNLTMQEHINNNFITIDSQNAKGQIISLNTFNFKLIEQKDLAEYITNEPGIQNDKLFTIDVYRIKKDKDFNNDFIRIMKQNYKPDNMSVLLYNIDDIKDNNIKNISKIIDKIKSKTGINEFSFIPYNEQYFPKFYSIVDNFFADLKKKIIFEYNNQLMNLFNKLYNKDRDKSNSNEKEIMYEYIRNKILYLDLLTIGELWDAIKRECTMDLFKVFPQIDNKFIFTYCSSEVNILEIKQKVKSKKITNIEYQIFLINHYMKSCRYLKDYEGLVHIMFNSSLKIQNYINDFESDYHYLYWNINYILNLINYSIALEEKLGKDIDAKNCIDKGMIYLYSSCIKYMKLYAKKIKLELPTVKLFMNLKNCIDNGISIKDELDKVTAGEIEENDIYKKFISDIKNIDTYYFDLNKTIFDILTNKKCFIEEYLHILQIINKKNCENLQRKISIRHFFEIIPGLITLNKFEEAKNILNDLIQDKIFTKKKLNYTHEFLSLLLVMLLYCLEKNKDNLKIMFKLLDTNFTNIKYFLAKLDCKDQNLINDIMSKYIETYNDKDDNDKINKIFSMDKALTINLEKHKDNMIFINKNKTSKEQIKYQITNNTGVNFNINKIQLVFEEFSESNDSNSNKNTEKEKKEIIYGIKDIDFKNIEPFIKNKEHTFDILLEENNDIFQLNTTYKFIKINYIINNILCGEYNIKEELKLSFNSIEMKVSTQIFPSYDSDVFSKSTINTYYFNTLSKIDMNITDLPLDELNNKILKIKFEDITKKEDTNLIIQTIILKEKLIKEYPDVIINDYNIEFPENSLKGKDKLNLAIPFYIENINFYASGNNLMKITVQIIDQKDNNKIIYSYTSFHNINLIHLFNIKKKFRIIKKNSFLMQSTFSLNIETSNIKVYTPTSNNFSFYIDTTQAINLVLLLQGEDSDIIKKLRQNFIKFSIDDTIENKKTEIKYRLCYPEKSIVDEIKELKEIPYHIKIDIENNKNDVFKELNLNINIKKNNKKKVLLMMHILDSENWAVIGKSKLIEKWNEVNDNNEKNIKVKILPLIDGFLKLPEIEFLEYEITEQEDDQIKINENDGNKDEFAIGKIKFDPIEYGTVVEGNEKVVNITPSNECSLKLNLT